jgi:hypothetical protein
MGEPFTRFDIRGFWTKEVSERQNGWNDIVPLVKVQEHEVSKLFVVIFDFHLCFTVRGYLAVDENLSIPKPNLGLFRGHEFQKYFMQRHNR